MRLETNRIIPLNKNKISVCSLKNVFSCIFDQLYRELRTRKLSSEEGLKYIYPGNCHQNRPSDGLTKSSHQINWLEMWCKLKYEGDKQRWLFFGMRPFSTDSGHIGTYKAKNQSKITVEIVSCLAKPRKSQIWDFRGKRFFTLRFGAFFTERAFWDICGQKFDLFWR